MSVSDNSALRGIYCDKNFTFCNNTTFGLGGKCKGAYYPRSIKEAALIFENLKNCGEEFLVLGAGSDILASDDGFNGYVIHTKHLKNISACGNKVISESGVSVRELLKFCIDNSLSGAEFLAGIPATIGGLTYMNGGAMGTSIADIIVSVTIFDGKLKNLAKNLCEFGNKHSIMRNINCIILNVELCLNKADGKNIKDNIARTLKLRSGQPKGKSCGCVFKNPEGRSAGEIIDGCGLKGKSVGDAFVSSEHANFIINKGSRAADVYNLIKLVKETVYSKTGINLCEEVVYIGDFNDSFS